MLNAQSNTLSKILGTVSTLGNILEVDHAHTQLVTMLMADLLRDTMSSIDSLATGRIPPYLVPLSLVEEILATATSEMITPLQAHLAYTLGYLLTFVITFLFLKRYRLLQYQVARCTDRFNKLPRRRHQHPN